MFTIYKNIVTTERKPPTFQKKLPEGEICAELLLEMMTKRDDDEKVENDVVENFISLINKSLSVLTLYETTNKQPTIIVS